MSVGVCVCVRTHGRPLPQTKGQKKIVRGEENSKPRPQDCCWSSKQIDGFVANVVATEKGFDLYFQMKMLDNVCSDSGPRAGCSGTHLGTPEYMSSQNLRM